MKSKSTMYHMSHLDESISSQCIIVVSKHAAIDSDSLHAKYDPHHASYLADTLLGPSLLFGRCRICRQLRRMLAAFLVFMATTGGPGCDEGVQSAQASQSPRQGGRTSRGGRRRSGAKARGRGARHGANRRPRPNHFLSVRINNSQIWHEVGVVCCPHERGDLHYRYGMILVGLPLCLDLPVQGAWQDFSGGCALRITAVVRTASTARVQQYS